MHSSSRLFALLAGLGFIGCGGGSISNAPDGNQLTYDTGSFVVPEGESLTCFYLDATTDRELAVASATGTQGPGGHHIIIYYIDAKETPQHHQCTDAEMVSWHQIAGAAASGNGEPILAFPEGVAIKVPAGKQLGIQAHYINTTTGSQKVDDTITLNLAEPSEVKAYTNFWAINDDSFMIPPNGQLTRKTVCPVNYDFETILLFGHMHEYGRRYRLDEVDANNQVVKPLYEESQWEPQYATHPPLKQFALDAPLKISKGTRLMQTCEWANTTPDMITFPTEMCAGVGYYVPDQGELPCDQTVVP